MSYQCEACSGVRCVMRCDKKPVYCPHYEHKDPCWVDGDQGARVQANTDLKEGDWAWGPVATCGDKDVEEYFKVLEVLSEGRVRANPYTLVFPNTARKPPCGPIKALNLFRW